MSALRVALNRPRALGAVAAAFLLEALLRAPLAVANPVLAVVCPPVVAVPLLGAAAPPVRAAVDDPDTDPDWRLGTLRDRLDPRLIGAAIVGHAAALAVGVAGFLLLDTAVRATVYALGGAVPTAVVLLAPLIGVSAGTLVAWALFVPALVALAAGESTAAARRAPLAALGDRRRTARSLGLHAVVALVGAGVFVAAMVPVTTLVVQRTPGYPVVAFAIAAGLLTLTAVVSGAVAVPVRIAWADRAGARDTPPVRNLALAALVVTALVAGAGAVRLTETRPTPDAGGVANTPDLPDNATAAYAAAVDRTGAGDSRVTVTHDGGLRVVRAIDRGNRRYRIDRHESDGTNVAYVDAGVDYSAGARWGLYALGARSVDGWPVLATPAYWRVGPDYSVTDGWSGTLPAPGTGEWRTVERGEGTVTVELTGGEAVARALLPSPPEDASYGTARVRMRIDADRGVLLGGEARLNVTGERSFERSLSYDVATGEGVRVERPEELGGRTPGEWLWKLFAY